MTFAWVHRLNLNKLADISTFSLANGPSVVDSEKTGANRKLNSELPLSKMLRER